MPNVSPATSRPTLLHAMIARRVRERAMRIGATINRKPLDAPGATCFADRKGASGAFDQGEHGHEEQTILSGANAGAQCQSI